MCGKKIAKGTQGPKGTEIAKETGVAKGTQGIKGTEVAKETGVAKETKVDKGNVEYGHTHYVLMRLCKITIDFSLINNIWTLFFKKMYDFLFD